MQGKLTILVILIALTNLATCFQNYTSNYTYYVFEREWAGTICKSRQCKSEFIANYNGSEFNIHGLWPSGEPGNNKYRLMNCNTSYDYNQSLIQPQLLNQMDDVYIGLYNNTFWFRHHEYKAHGSCYNYPQNVTTKQERENTFFGKIMQVNAQYPLISTLKDYGIYPKENKYYRYQEFISAIMEGFDTQYQPSLGCQTIKGGRQALKVIQLCLDLNFELMECPTYKHSCNPSKPIVFPPFYANHYNQNSFLQHSGIDEDYLFEEQTEEEQVEY